MGVLSKPLEITFEMLGYYFLQLYQHPIRTKVITSSIMSSLANYISQKMINGKLTNINSFLAFGIFGLLFGGTIPHYFYEQIKEILTLQSKTSLFQFFCIERLFFMPLFLFFSLYMLSRLEGKNHEKAFDSVSAEFGSIFETNIKYFTLFQFINIYFVPPMLKVIVSNFLEFIWYIVLSHKRQEKEKKEQKIFKRY